MDTIQPASRDREIRTDAVSRRSFVQHSSAAGLALGLSAFATASPDQPPSSLGAAVRKFKICLTPGMINVRANLQDSLILASQFGFEAIDPGVGELSTMSSQSLSEFRDQMKQKGIVWGAAGMSMPTSGPDEAFKRWLAKLPQTASTLQKAGATRAATWINPGDNRLTYLQQFHQLAGRVKEIATIFDDHGVRFGMEYLGPKTMRNRYRYQFIHSMKEMRELIAETGKRNVALLLDSWHWYNAQDSVADIRALHSDDIVWVHLNDAPAGVPLDQQVDNHRALPAATSVIDIGGFLAALIAIGYDGPASAEPFDNSLGQLPREEAVKRTIDAIHKALERAQNPK
jgi:sugar phosphate isomerase/epimerase